MTPSRILLVVVAVVIAAAAAFLLAQGLTGLGQETAPAAEDGRESSKNRDGETSLPSWEDYAHEDYAHEDYAHEDYAHEDYTHEDGAEATVPRPTTLTEAARATSSPFDAAYDRARLERLALRLEGIASGFRPLALVSGRVVRPGDQVDVFRIARIASSGVVLAGPSGAEFTLAPGTGAPPEEAPDDGASRRPGRDRTVAPGGIWPGTVASDRSRPLRTERESTTDRLVPLRELTRDPAPFSSDSARRGRSSPTRLRPRPDGDSR